MGLGWSESLLPQSRSSPGAPLWDWENPRLEAHPRLMNEPRSSPGWFVSLLPGEEEGQEHPGMRSALCAPKLLR